MPPVKRIADKSPAPLWLVICFFFLHSTKELCLLCHVWQELQVILTGPLCEQRPSGHLQNSNLWSSALCNNNLGLHNPNRICLSSWSQGSMVNKDCASWMASWQPLHMKHAWAEHAYPQLCFGVDNSGLGGSCHRTISFPVAMSAVALPATCGTPKKTLKQMNLGWTDWSAS